MFILRIAGDVLGQKRNIEVAFPRRPSLQQIYTVAETLLPLQAGDERRPWRPPGPLNGSGLIASPSPVDPADLPHIVTSAPRHRTAFAGEYIVESVVFVNPGTRQWEEVYSASQLSSGSQVYCFSPLQHHRVAVIKDRRSASPSSTHSAAHLHFTTSPLKTLPVVSEVRDSWVNADRPGAIPEPQQHLVWDCTAMPTDRVAPGVSQGERSKARLNRALSSRISADNSRNLSCAVDTSAVAASSAHQTQSASPLFTSDSPSPLLPSSFLYGNSELPHSEKTPRQGDVNRSSILDHPYRTINKSRVSLSHGSPYTNAHSHPMYFTHSCAVDDTGSEVSRVNSYRRAGWRSLEASMGQEDQRSYNSATSPSSTFLLSGGGEDRYANLGERLAVLFDVLVHLDAQDSNTERHYVLLRDFYLLSSFLVSSSTNTGGRAGGFAVPPNALNLTEALSTQFGLSWDDLLRIADQDRDGCIAYCEWITFGIEHPDVIRLLCEGVCRLPLQLSAAMKRLHLQSCISSAARSTASTPTVPVKARKSGSNSFNVPAPSARSPSRVSYPCCVHSEEGSEGMRDSVAANPLGEQNGYFAFEGRCEACRELAAQTPEERLLWASKPTPFFQSLRR